MATTLWDAIDSANAAAFWSEKRSNADRSIDARAIAARQGLPQAYGSSFGLTPAEQKRGIRLFTGEHITNAGARHISGEEGCRALLLLGCNDRAVSGALDRATAGLMGCLSRSEHEAEKSRMGSNPGTFCCGPCTVSVWRHVSAGGLDRAEERLSRGVKRLAEHRNSSGRWRVFPFWYTVSALIEMPREIARPELRYLAPLLERAAKRAADRGGNDDLPARRGEIARRAMKMI